MHKFVYFTDSQADSTELSFRTDNFQETIIKKFEEVIETANDLDCDVFCGGDFVDRPHLTDWFSILLMRTWKKLRNDFYCVLGNHDIVGRNLASYGRASLGILEESDRMIIFSDQKLIREGFVMQAVPFTEVHRPSLYATNEKTIFITHNMVLPSDARDRVVFEHLIPPEISPKIKTPGSLVLSGHSHIPFDEESNGVRFINPGSLGRVSRQNEEMKRTVQVAIIKLNDGKFNVEYRLLKSCPDWRTVFVKKPEKKEEKTLDLSDLKNLLHSSKAQSFSISQFVRLVAKKNKINAVVREEALERIANAEAAFSDDRK